MSFRNVWLISWGVLFVLFLKINTPLLPSVVLGGVLALLPAALAGRGKKNGGDPNMRSVPGEPPMTVTYAAENVALDVPARRVWLRDVNGRQMIVDISQIAAWEHTWRDSTNGAGRVFRTQNTLTFRLRQLDVPSVRVRFKRYSDAFGGNRNFNEAEEWQARLTTFINS